MTSIIDESSLSNNGHSSPTPEYRPPARRTSRIMMSLLNEELQSHNTNLQNEIQAALNEPSL